MQSKEGKGIAIIVGLPSMKQRCAATEIKGRNVSNAVFMGTKRQVVPRLTRQEIKSVVFPLFPIGW